MNLKNKYRMGDNMKVRDIFFTKIYDKVKAGENIIIVSSDIGAPSLDRYRKEFPHRFVNVGIAEQNSITVAAGLQLSNGDKRVITYGLNPFPVTRAFDQLRNMLASLEIPITVTALNAGSCSADAGYTHMAVENMSIIRTLDNIQIINISDEAIAVRLVDEILSNPYPRYVQFDKFIDGRMYKEDEIDFNKGFITNGNGDILVITYGIMAKKINSMNLPVKVFDFFCLPIDEEEFIKEVSSAKKIITVEDNVLKGGIGSMVLEILNDRNIKIPVFRKGLCFNVGYPKIYTNRELLFNEEGLSDNDIENFLRKVCQG